MNTCNNAFNTNNREEKEEINQQQKTIAKLLSLNNLIIDESNKMKEDRFFNKLEYILFS